MMTAEQFENAFKWLADAPLFIDETQVGRFFDAVAVPRNKVGASTVEFGSERVISLLQKLAGEGSAGLTVAKFLELAKAKLSAEFQAEEAYTKSNTTSVIFEPIDTPQRQLITLARHYQDKQASRSFYVTDLNSKEWQDPAVITDVPRELVFFDLPPNTVLIPAASEHEKDVALHFRNFKDNAGNGPTDYQQEGYAKQTDIEKRRAYWGWFVKNFKVQPAVEAIEKAAANHGRIRWIDFRTPISPEMDTLHLHVAAYQKYETGIFAYNLVRRAFEHGIRMVGTLKSEPDMDVLAIYNK